MKAIILAAGMGSRLGRYTKDNTKAMVEVNGKKLIENSLDILNECGVCEVIIVVGYKKKKKRISELYWRSGKILKFTSTGFHVLHILRILHFRTITHLFI